MLAGVLESPAVKSRRGRAFGFTALLTWSLGLLVLCRLDDRSDTRDRRIFWRRVRFC